jgi:hypothetical protein
VTGAPVEVAVQSNFYALSVPEIAPPRRVEAPDGSSTIPGPPMPIEGTLDWLDGDGRVIGPQR